MRREFRRIMFEKDQQRLRRATEKCLSVQVDTSGLPAWRDVVEPHGDVARGTFQLAQFAADLRQVHQGVADPAYNDPSEFFGRTFITRGLRYLLEQAIARFTGTGGEPVIDLMTTFGGGKTHSLLAVYHIASGLPADQLPGIRDLLDQLGVQDLPTGVKRVVLVGNDLSVLGSTKPDGTVVNTMWGEMAYQLGGPEAFGKFERYDANAAPPTTTDLANLLAAYSPCVILVDEWVAYLRQLWSREVPSAAGTFDSHMTFVQSLTEATKAVPNALLLVSLPASDAVREMEDGSPVIENEQEIGGTAGLEALRALRSFTHRVEAAWSPATSEESYEIVRRRLFKPFGSDEIAARDLVVRRFMEHYQKHAMDVPTEVMQPSFRQSIKTAYPIHPELFKRLYEDWSTLERFQRTRGVLRLMAQVVHALWTSGDKSPMILPASIPLDAQKVFDEITNPLDDSWKPIVESDIAGDTSAAAHIDNEIKVLGRTMAAKRAARCVFLGTAPMVNRRSRDGGEQTVRGIEQKRVVLGSTYPGDNPAHVADALRRLGDLGKYMNREQDRYWLSLQQTVSQIAQERADSYHETQVYEELAAFVRQENDQGLFERVHRFPPSSADVDDSPGIGLVIFGPDCAHSRKGDSAAQGAAREFLLKRGSAARINRNSLVFLAPDVARVDTMLTAVRQKMAWESILENKRELNLDQHNITLATNRATQAKQTLAGAIRDAYRWIINPHQEPGQAEITFESIHMNGEGTLAERVTRKADAGEFVMRTYSPSLLRMEIDRLGLWKKEPHVQLSQLETYFTQYLYMPKLVRPEILVDVVYMLDSLITVEYDGFAYADGYEAGRYVGLTTRSPVKVAHDGLLVEPHVADQQIAEETAATKTEDESDDAVPPAGRAATTAGGGGAGPGPASAVQPERLNATKVLSSQRVVKDAAAVFEEIISHFVSAGADITVSIDLESTQLAKLTPEQVAAIRENLTSLGFDPNDWSIE
jgi:predicted AAA+ superfamily ATPase